MGNIDSVLQKPKPAINQGKNSHYPYFRHKAKVMPMPTITVGVKIALLLCNNREAAGKRKKSYSNRFPNLNFQGKKGLFLFKLS